MDDLSIAVAEHQNMPDYSDQPGVEVELAMLLLDDKLSESKLIQIRGWLSEEGS